MKKIVLSLLGAVCLCFPSFAVAQDLAEQAEMEQDKTDNAPTGFLTVVNLETGEKEELPLDPNLTSTPGLVSSDPSMLPTQMANVIGKEDWYQVKDNRVVALMMKMPFLEEGEQFCSGAMVGPYAVLTAAHCVIGIASGEIIPPDFVYPGGTSGGVGKVAVSKTGWIATGYRQGAENRFNFDYAIILLEKPIGNKTGYFGVKDAFLNIGKEIAIIGFPGEKKINLPWYSPGKITWNTPNSPTFEHDADAVEGSSGAPMVVRKDPGNIVAILTGGGEEHNIATRPPHGGLVDFVNKYKFKKPN